MQNLYEIYLIEKNSFYYKIGNKTKTGYIFDIQGDIVFECMLEDLNKKYNWDIAKKLCECFPPEGEWRLPSKEELTNIYLNLYLKGKGNFDDEVYWSSDTIAMDFAYYICFSNKYKCYYINKNFEYNVRYIRSYKIGDKK